MQAKQMVLIINTLDLQSLLALITGQLTLVCLCVCVCDRWEELNSLADQRRRLLAGAEQVHRFVRDAVETNDRMNEKVLIYTVMYLS